VKRSAVGIWDCRSCRKVIAGGAWTVSTTAAATVRRSVLLVSSYCCVAKFIELDFPPILASHSTVRRLAELREA
jgi:large subunit ribosomal protein L37Ae